MDDLQFYVFFNHISVVPGWEEGDNERLYTMESHLHLKKFASLSWNQFRVSQIIHVTGMYASMY